ncbi:MAG: hypothetical protein QOE77_4284, partial [Blastocatellia bacterium]|nr:hypothetical protein [Blastocatellia bacterium]
MSVHRVSLFITTVAVVAIAMPVHAQNLKQVGTIPVPGNPINQFGVLTIDQTTGLGYLADKDNKAVVVFDTKADKYVSRITGFVGMTKNGDASGPNGVQVVKGGS